LAEESPITNPDLYEEIDEAVTGGVVEVEKPKKKKRRSGKLSIPLPLDKLSGKEVIEILDFLHKRYLSWMTEAEASKYSVVYKSAKEDALKESLEIYNELSKQIASITENLNKLAEKLATVNVTPQQIAKEVVQETKRSLLDDPRVRTLIFVGLESLLGKNPQYQKLRPLIASILMPEAFQGRPREQHKEAEPSSNGEQ